MALGLLLAVYVATLPLIRLQLPLPTGQLVNVSDLALAVLLLAATVDRRWQRPPARLLLAALLPPLAAALAVVSSDGPLLPGLREVRRMIVPMVTLVALASLRLGPANLRLAARVWTLTAVVVCLIGLGAFLAVVGLGFPAGTLAQPNSPNLGPGVVRISGVLPTNALSLYLVVSVGFGAFLLRGAGSRASRWSAAALALMIVTAFLSLSRGAVGLALTLSLLAYRPEMAPGWLGRHRRSVVLIAVMLAVAGVLATYWAVFPVSMSRGRAGASGIALNLRPNAYRVLHTAGLRMFRAHPWTGVGPTNFGPRLSAFTSQRERAEAWPPLAQPASYPPHSTWIGTLAEGGLVSATSLLMLLFTVGAMLLPSANPGRLAGFVGLSSVGLLFNGLHVDFIHLRFIWAAAGLGANEYLSQRHGPRP